MKLKLVVVDLDLSKRERRILTAVLVPVLVLGGGALAYASNLHVWTDGDSLNATDLNGNFSQLDGRTTMLEAAKATDEQTLTMLSSSAAALQSASTADEKTIGTLSSSVAALQSAGTADEKTLAQLQGVVGAIVQKPGNNGTTTCDTFCAGTGWGPSGTCVGAYDLGIGQFVSCGTLSQNPPVDGLRCYCSQFTF